MGHENANRNHAQSISYNLRRENQRYAAEFGFFCEHYIAEIVKIYDYVFNLREYGHLCYFTEQLSTWRKTLLVYMGGELTFDSLSAKRYNAKSLALS